MRIAKRAGIFIALLIVIATVCQPVAADASDPLYFPLTCHFVKDQFLDFYSRAPDPLTLFGYPITDAFIDQTGHLTQYFQRARFNLEMTEKGPTVSLANLGWYLYDDSGEALNYIQFEPTCRKFPATGKSVCFAFLQFYDAHQGEIYFGNPISEAEMRDGRIVQYFDKVRMEFLTTLPEGHRVILTQLGRPAFDKYVGNQELLWNCGRDAVTISPLPVENITARAFVRAPLIAAGTSQALFVIVQDQNLQPVSGAQASITVVNPDGARFTFRPPGVTDKDGILKVDLKAPELAPRQVVTMEITAELKGLKAKTATWYRVWY